MSWLGKLRSKRSSSATAMSDSNQMASEATSIQSLDTHMGASLAVGRIATLSQLRIFKQIAAERLRQDVRHGPIPPTRKTGTGAQYKAQATKARNATDLAAENGTVTWLDILKEEFYEAAAEAEWVELREELVQVAAVAVSWIEDGDKRAQEVVEGPQPWT